MHLFFLISALVLIIDQASKLSMLYVFDLANVRSLEVFPPYLSFEFAWNKGINFGLFSTNYELARWALIIFSGAICLFLAIYTFKSLSKTRERVLAGCIFGGAIGNVLDRMVHGAVVDFLNVSCCGIVNKYSFNFADIGIFVGVFGLIVFSWKRDESS